MTSVGRERKLSRRSKSCRERERECGSQREKEREIERGKRLSSLAFLSATMKFFTPAGLNGNPTN